MRQAFVSTFLLGIFFVLALRSAQGADFSGVPGVVINHLEPPTVFEKALNVNEHYTSDPSIVVMPNGDYIVTHSEFDSGTTATTSGKTWVFKSTDDGATWNEVEILNDMHRGSLFVQNGDLYLLGYKAAPGNIVIRKSTDSGDTWTTATNSTNGLLFTGNHGGTPNNPVVYNGRIWSARGTSLLSADVNDDLLNASSWTLSNSISQNPNGDWLDGAFTFWSEGQVIASPQTGVVIMPKISNLPYSAIINADETTGNILFDFENDFVSLPGAEKKFGATYDAVGGKFYALTSIVLPAHAGGSITPALTRNTAAMLSSDDLHHWDVEKIFLYSQNLDANGFGEGFQYFNFDFDGDNMVIASRTAYDTTGNGTVNLPPRGHDSNLITFHRIDDFRTATPDQQLVVDTSNNRVLRQELNGNDDIAPLGDFTLGATFAGAALNSPVDLVQDGSSGLVYIKEQGGRILEFDAGGNFLNVVTSAPVPFQGTQISVTQPAQGERSWIASGSADWHDPTNWYYWGRPDTPKEVAYFGSAAESASTITMNESLSIKGFRFRNVNTYTLDGTGDLTFKAGSGNSVIDVQLGDHEVKVAVKFDSEIDANAENGTNLRFRDRFDLNGKTMTLSGLGQLRVYNEFVMNGGKIVVDGNAIFTFANSVNATLDGTLQFVPDVGITPSFGDTFDLLNGIGFVGDTFNNVLLPELADGLVWNTTSLYTNGEVSVTMAGDFDLDGDVDVNDLTDPTLGWQTRFGLDLDGGDFLTWQRQFGNGAGAAFAAVPEPTTLALVFVYLIGRVTVNGRKFS